MTPEQFERLIAEVRKTRPRRIFPKHGATHRTAMVQPSGGIQWLVKFDACADLCDGPPPENIVVQVSYDLPELTADFTNIVEAAKVICQWGEVDHIVRADIVRGVPLVLAGSRVNVGIEYPITAYTLPGQVPPPPAQQPPIRVKVTLGFDGTKAEPGITGNARFTQTIGTIPTGNSATFQVPDWAVSVGLQSSVATVVGMEIQFFADPNAVLPLSSVSIGKGDNDTAPVPNGAMSYLIVNAAIVDALGVRAIFTLGI